MRKMILAVLVCGCMLVYGCKDKKQQQITGGNLSQIGKALLVYSNDFDNYPVPSKWCDLLIENADMPRTVFRSGTSVKGPSNFALNPNCDPNSAGEMILLFETQPGWNQYGGPELLDSTQDGCHVLLNDSSVHFFKKHELNSLKWK